jgi:hypothetical protein
MRNFLARSFALPLWLLISHICIPSAAHAFTLITEEEARVFNSSTQHSLSPKSVGVNNTPSIDVVAPQYLSKPVSSPLNIELLFRAEGASIDMRSFAAYYGSLRLDVTSRILKRAIMTESGLKIDNVQIPRGTHTFFLHIRDQTGRSNSRELTLTVE